MYANPLFLAPLKEEISRFIMQPTVAARADARARNQFLRWRKRVSRSSRCRDGTIAMGARVPATNNESSSAAAASD